LVLTPFFTNSRATEAKLGLSLALRSATTASWVVRRAHLGEDSELDQQMLDLASKSFDLLKEWNSPSQAEPATE
jgi:hypothetical protein